jgi:hypothetical protein
MAKRVDFKYLRNLERQRPKSKAALIRLLWPEIKRALDRGHSLKKVKEVLGKDGITIEYSRLRYYVGRLKRHSSVVGATKPTPAESVSSTVAPLSGRSQPAELLFGRRTGKAKFQHDPFSTSKDDLI